MKGAKNAVMCRMPADLYDRLKQASEERDLSMNNMMNRAIKDYLDRLIPIEEFRIATE